MNAEEKTQVQVSEASSGPASNDVVHLSAEDVAEAVAEETVPEEERLFTDGDETGEEELPYVKEEGEASIDGPHYPYESVSVEQKLEMAMKEKEKGNALFKQHEFEQAWKLYDSAFVNIFIGKEEWAALDDEAREMVNKFKAPCHSNRGLCRLKLKQFSHAHWDFSEAIRIDDTNVKAHYRRSLAKMGLIREQMDKELEGKYWDVEQQENEAKEAREDLKFAVEKLPNDKAIRDALKELAEIEDSLRKSKKKYRLEQQQLFSGFLRRDDEKVETEQGTEKPIDYSTMPELEEGLRSQLLVYGNLQWRTNAMQMEHWSQELSHQGSDISAS